MMKMLLSRMASTMFAVGLGCGNVSATTIPYGTSLGLNFDFSTSAPAPPYSTYTVGYFIDYDFTITVYADAGGQGAVIGTGKVANDAILTFVNNPLALDGIFSIIVSPIVNPTPFNGNFSVEIAGCSPTQCVNPPLRGTIFTPGAAVPEPATLALLAFGGLGLFGAARARRRA